MLDKIPLFEIKPALLKLPEFDNAVTVAAAKVAIPATPRVPVFDVAAKYEVAFVFERIPLFEIKPALLKLPEFDKAVTVAAARVAIPATPRVPVFDVAAKYEAAFVFERIPLFEIKPALLKLPEFDNAVTVAEAKVAIPPTPSVPVLLVF